MNTRKMLNLFISILIILTTIMGPLKAVEAMPASPVDETKVPHYFGPNPNWANSPFTLPDVAVAISGDGTGATATAKVGGNGALTGLDITNPGIGYHSATVDITGAGNGATASASVTLSGIVTGIKVDKAGAGYTSPVVSINGGGGQGTLVQVGNSLADRAYATDYATAPTITQPSVSAAATHTYNVTAGSANGGTFTLTVDGATTAPIAWNAPAADVQAALAAANVTATVTGTGPWAVVFAAAPAAVSIDGAGLTLTAPVADAGVSGPTAPDTFNATIGSANGGTFTLTVDAVTTGALAWNAATADVVAALNAAGVTAAVTGSGSVTEPWVIVFAAAPATVTMDPTALTLTSAAAGASALASATSDTYNLQIGSAIGGTFALNIAGVNVTGLAYNVLAVDLQAALVAAGVNASVSANGAGWVITFAVPPASFTVDGAGLTQPTTPNMAPVFVVLPKPLPVGILKAFEVQNQASAGSSPYPSAGQSFHAYLLRPVSGQANQYTVVLDSGVLTMPALANPAVSEVATFTVPDTAVQSGDVIGFYGSGIPTDIVSTGTDILSYPAPNAPAANSTVSLGSANFPIYPQARTYSFAASVLDTSKVVALVDATATAYGGVDLVHLDNAGDGYTNPTVDFDLPDDPNGVQAQAHAIFDPTTGAITSVVLDNPGSGYAQAPKVVIRNGTLFDPINSTGSGAAAHATLAISSISVDTYGSGYASAPSVTIADSNGGSGSGALASASVSAGGVTGITLLNPGSGYITQGGIKKFTDGLPQLCIPAAGQTFADCVNNNLGQHIPVGVPDTTTFSKANGFTPEADYYVIALVQHRERMSSSLPATGTLLREYVQLQTPANVSFSKGVALTNDLPDGTSVPALLPDGTQAIAVDEPHYLGPVISATKDKPVRIVFYNLLPTGAKGDLFIPVDSSMMGSGMGPMMMADPVDQGTVMDMVRNPVCTENPKDGTSCFKDNRATLHLHGGTTPWISDGTPHQWITPANEQTPWPQGVSVSEVPDMANVPGVPNCSAKNDGCMTFYYTNQQSARLMFYHDHAWGITRLNVYAGEAAGYLITDPTEQKLISSGLIPAEQIPLIIQDRTFVPQDTQLYNQKDSNGNILSYGQDPTWDQSRWGKYGDLWYHHVYMPAQNPGDPSGMSAYGRWMYGPWFWPPAGTAKYQPIANPYYDPNCNLDNPATWQYQTDPFCEPKLIPGTPNISVGMEQFNDTPVVNGTAYPTTTVQPKSYRMRILNAANDRFWNLQWYVADPTTGTNSEVALKASELAAAQTDPNVFPTPDTNISPVGPSWIQIASEGGFLPAPTVVPNQPITWITDPTRFDFGNVDKHALLLAPAERADVIVDFSKYAGKTLILYNDAPAAFPARVASYDYYTGAPDLSPAGAPSPLPGYGPNTRTIMQVKVAAAAPAPAFNLTALQAAFKHHADGSGVFEAGQHPIIVGQAAYNSAYGTSFAASSWCNAPGSTLTKCDGLARISEQGGDLFGFNTLKSPNTKLSIKLEPKALHDEMNSASFDEFGRMTANLGLEAVPANPAAQNIILYPYVNPSTELIDATNLPKGDINVAPISSADGTQIWKITHNGVDTHPIHFHLYDVQVLNRVTWDNIIIPTEPNELGWKDTIRVSPLEDTIVALRPIIPTLPFELPNSIRELNPMMPDGDTSMFNPVDAAGNPTNPVVNSLVNFGWEYVYHCHILSHEEMDMMRPVSVAMPPIAPDGLAYAIAGTGNKTTLTLTWNDNSINETSFDVQKRTGTGAWVTIGTLQSPLDQPNKHELRTFVDTTFRVDKNVYSYQVVAKNTIGYGGQFMSMTVQSISPVLAVIPAPTGLTATLAAGATGAPQVNMAFTDNAANETGFLVQRSTDGVNFTTIATAPAHANTGATTFVDTTIAPSTSAIVNYTYRIAATVTGVGSSAFSNTASVAIPIMPAAPTSLKAVNGPNGNGNTRSVILTWTANTTNVTGFTIQRATNAAFTAGLTSMPAVATATTLTVTGLSRNTAYYFRIRANNGTIVASGWTSAAPLPITTLP